MTNHIQPNEISEEDFNALPEDEQIIHRLKGTRIITDMDRAIRKMSHDWTTGALTAVVIWRGA